MQSALEDHGLVESLVELYDNKGICWIISAKGNAICIDANTRSISREVMDASGKEGCERVVSSFCGVPGASDPKKPNAFWMKNLEVQKFHQT